VSIGSREEPDGNKPGGQTLQWPNEKEQND
jgi:hypothetical protein